MFVVVVICVGVGCAVDVVPDGVVREWRMFLDVFAVGLIPGVFRLVVNGIGVIIVVVVVDVVLIVVVVVVEAGTQTYLTSIATYLTSPHFRRSGPFVTSTMQTFLPPHELCTLDATSLRHLWSIFGPPTSHMSMSGLSFPSTADRILRTRPREHRRRTFCPSHLDTLIFSLPPLSTMHLP